jgi:acetyltransferase-like isoleucine patch superfamily enzyme
VKDGTVRIGRQLSVRGIIAPVEMGAAAGAHLDIGDKVFINQGASLVARRRIVIGDHSKIGDFSAIYDSNFHALEPGAAVVEREVVIGRNVWIGRGCIILPGTIIDDNAVIAAGSVVRGHVPPNVLMAGNLATMVRPLRHEDGWVRS